MKIIGVVGLNGSGKDEVVNYLNKKYDVPLISVGDIVRSIATREGIEPTRDNLDEITKTYFKRFGAGYFVKQVAEKILREKWTTAGISGIRSPQDAAILKEVFKLDFVLINVYISDSRERYKRIFKRGSKRDQSTYEDFLRQDKISQDLFHIQDTIKLADLSVPNDGSLEDLHRSIDTLVADKNLLK